MTDLLASDHPVVVSGTVANQVLFYDRFAAIVLLSAPLDVLLERVSTRANNPYGRTLGDQQSIRRHVRDIEPLLREGATLELDGRLPVSTLADQIELLLHDAPPS